MLIAMANEIEIYTPTCPNNLGTIAFNGPFGGAGPFKFDIFKYVGSDYISQCDENYAALVFKVDNDSSFDDGIKIICGNSSVPGGFISLLPDLGPSDYAGVPTCAPPPCTPVDHANGAAFLDALKTHIEVNTNEQLILDGFKPISVLLNTSGTSGIMTLLVDKNIAGCCAQILRKNNQANITYPFGNLVQCCPPLTAPVTNNTTPPAGGYTPTSPPSGYLYISTLPIADQGSIQVPSGVYICQITDANGQVTQFTTIISNPPYFACGAEVKDITCHGENNGQIITSPFLSFNDTPSFLWKGPNSFISNEKDITNLEPGTYTLTVTNTFGCKTSCSYTIFEPEIITATVNVQYPECVNCNDAITTVISVTGGTTTCRDCEDLPTGYRYKIEPVMVDFEPLPSNDFYREDLGEGKYKLIIQDCNCCKTTTPFEIKVEKINLSY